MHGSQPLGGGSGNPEPPLTRAWRQASKSNTPARVQCLNASSYPPPVWAGWAPKQPTPPVAWAAYELPAHAATGHRVSAEFRGNAHGVQLRSSSPVVSPGLQIRQNGQTGHSENEGRVRWACRRHAAWSASAPNLDLPQSAKFVGHGPSLPEPHGPSGPLTVARLEHVRRRVPNGSETRGPERKPRKSPPHQ